MIDCPEGFEPVYHDFGDKACNGVAFFYRRGEWGVLGRFARSQDMIGPNGEEAKPGQIIRCFNCNTYPTSFRGTSCFNC